MDIEVKEHAEFTEIIVNESRIDKNISNQFRDSLKQICTDNPTGLVLNLSNVDFIDSSGLGAIITGQKCLGKSNRIAICGAKESILQLLSLTKLTKVLNIRDDC